MAAYLSWTKSISEAAWSGFSSSRICYRTRQCQSLPPAPPILHFTRTDHHLHLHRFKRTGVNAMRGRGIGTARGRATIMRGMSSSRLSPCPSSLITIFQPMPGVDVVSPLPEASGGDHTRLVIRIPPVQKCNRPRAYHKRKGTPDCRMLLLHFFSCKYIMLRKITCVHDRTKNEENDKEKRCRQA